MKRYEPKDLGEVFDGKWVLIYAESYYKPNNPSKTTSQYTFENVYNHHRITLTRSAFDRVKSGKTSISRFIAHYNWCRFKTKPKYANMVFGKSRKQTAVVDYRIPNDGEK